MLSASVRVRPFLAYLYLRLPANRPADAVSAWQSRRARNSLVRACSSGRMPAYSSATFKAVVASLCPPRASSASSSRRPRRNRRTSISTDVSSKKCINQCIRSNVGTAPASWLFAVLHYGLHSQFSVSAPRRPRHPPVQDDLWSSMRSPCCPENAGAFAGELPRAPFRPGTSCVLEDQPRRRSPGASLLATARGRVWCAYVLS
jgi:hypothetical protein